jgi:hypothetical protein
MPAAGSWKVKAFPDIPIGALSDLQQKFAAGVVSPAVNASE